MGNNCSCLHGGNTDEKQVITDKNTVGIDKNITRSLEGTKSNTDAKNNSIDIRVELSDIIKIESVLRGYLERRKIKEFTSKYFSDGKNKPEEKIRQQSINRNTKTIEEIIRTEIHELDPSKVPDYTNSSAKMMQTKLGPFIYRGPDDKNLIKRGPVQMENEAIYIGEWSTANKRHGKGVQKWNDGSVYEGYWSNDKANGKGRLIHANGDVYEGDWLDDKASGKGIYIHNDGAKYEGEWLFDKQHGFGMEIWPDGAKYQGMYENGHKHGHGIFKWADGSVYDGDFMENNIQGKGVYTWSDGRKYSGDWKNNKMDGKGLFTWSDGRSYEGEYQDDKKHGFGIFVWPDGRKYEGNWNDGKQHGLGSYTTTKKGKKEGEWKNGKKIKVTNT